MMQQIQNDENIEQPKLQAIVKEIIISSIKLPKQKSNVKRIKWNPESIRLFFKLYNMFSGDLNMVHTYFQEHTDYKFTKKQIKKKYSDELHNLNNSIHESIDEEIQAKLFESNVYHHSHEEQHSQSDPMMKEQSWP